MLITVTGGSGSGKSAYAEKRILDLGERERFYIATMIPWDKECRERIRRHRKMRQEKGFTTIEQYKDLEQLKLPEKKAGNKRAVLLECMSNLTANQMYGGGEKQDWEQKILFGVASLYNQTDDLIIVTNEVFSDGLKYHKDTEAYIKTLGQINCRLASISQEVTEVVYGIPIYLKGGGR